jgi:hypothetical protein
MIWVSLSEKALRGEGLTSSPTPFLDLMMSIAPLTRIEDYQYRIRERPSKPWIEYASQEYVELFM